MSELEAGTLPQPAVVAFGARERARDLLKRSLPRRRGRLTLARNRAEVLAALKESYTDAVVVDLAQPTDEHWAVARLAREFPSIPFLALGPLRPNEAPHLARACGEFEFADLLVEGAEDAVIRELLLPLTSTSRFADALRGADGALGLTSDLQRMVWRLVVGHGGRTVRTETIADAVGLTREHLSRRFSADGAPNLKRVIDLARILAAADLSKNPGYDLPDVSRVLGFASASHLSSSCQRLIGVKSSSLARLRPGDLVDRFVKQGRGRSRAAV
ncbi:MAG: hypothetical protein K8S21_05875 [Gemmatimonadetes bacterium]|nr:hypothetical protein [Gemmatimonadota bacterium]